MRILFVHNSFRRFVELDRDILAREHDVDELDLSVRSRIASLPRRIACADLVFCWFAGLHSFLPAIAAALARTPLLVIAGGYDAANMPEIGFGHMAHPWKRHAVRAICDRASLIVTHSHYAASSIELNIRPRTPIEVVHLGIDAPSAVRLDAREPVALSVGLLREENLLRKGHEVYVRSAALVPDARFVLAGRWMDGSPHYLRSIASSNVEVRDHIPDAQLGDLYSRGSVYVQASAHESFGLAVIEAMSRGMIPVVSSRGALPEIAGDDAVYVDETDVTSVAEGVRDGMSAGEGRRAAMVERVRLHFPLSGRSEGILDAVESLTRLNRRTVMVSLTATGPQVRRA
ncbi:MAG TPA: glycosyltransferase [Chloroflexota bacterium]|nr:glycosyltransferase [Chloroflexota bacterium]